MKKIMQTKYLFFLLLLIAACGPEESDKLVNPPPKAESVKVRFINFAGDKQARSLDILKGLARSEEVPYGAVSPAFTPPADSAVVGTVLNGSVDFQGEQLLRWLRNQTYTFIALPNPDETNPDGAVDTLVSLRTTSAIPEISNDAFIKVMNAYPDSTVTFTITVGCPNGETLQNRLQYRSYSANANPVLSGNIAFSLIKNSEVGDEIINLYETTLLPKGQYSLIISKNEFGEPQLLLLDELEPSRNSLTQMPVITDRNSRIRTINFSSETVTTKKATGELINADVAPQSIATYTDIPTCVSDVADTLLTTIGDETVSLDYAALQVLKDYTLCVFDSSSSLAGKTIAVPPPVLDEPLGDRALVRVLHASAVNGGITASLGSRTDAESPAYEQRRYTSGQVLAEGLSYGQLSQKTYLTPGKLPINIFTSSQPAKLLYVTLAEVEAGKSYLLVVTNDAEGKERISLIPDDTESQAVEYLEEGALVQFVHAVYNREELDLTINPPLLEGAKMFFSGTLGTVVKKGTNSLSIGGKQFSFEADPEKRTLIIAAGEEQDFDIFKVESTPLPQNYKYHTVRFVHASKRGPQIIIRQDTSANAFTYGILNYRDETPPIEDVLERKLTFYFVSSADQKKILNIMTDAFLPHGKRYTVLFAGKPGDYNTILVQEF